MQKLAEQLMESLMKRVWSPFSALVSVDQEGKILDICQFDTMFGNINSVPDEAASFLLLTNHPEGYTALYHEDCENIKRIRTMARGREVHVFICTEDTGCVEFKGEET